jgi:hypothetical protein
VARAERGPAVHGEIGVETASEDLLFERTDLGPGAYTLIAAGDPIPVNLAGLRRVKRKG